MGFAKSWILVEQNLLNNKSTGDLTKKNKYLCDSLMLFLHQLNLFVCGCYFGCLLHHSYKSTMIYKNNIPGTFEALGAPVHHIVFMLYFR